MKKMGSINFYNDVNFNIKFNFEDLMDFVFKDKFLKKGVSESDTVKDAFVDENGSLKMDIIDKSVEIYVNSKIKEKFGDEYALDVMDDTMNISWDISVDSIKKTHKEEWWNKEENQVN